MLLPRPEIRIATRLTSRIVGRGPVLRSVPRAGLAVNRASARALLDAADLQHRFACTFELGGHGGGKLRSDDQHHADAAIERARHLVGSNRAALLEQSEYRR